jgi:hypothetical protein
MSPNTALPSYYSYLPKKWIAKALEEKIDDLQRGDTRHSNHCNAYYTDFLVTFTPVET